MVTEGDGGTLSPSSQTMGNSADKMGEKRNLLKSYDRMRFIRRFQFGNLFWLQSDIHRVQ